MRQEIRFWMEMSKIGGYKNVAKDTFLDGDVKNW